MQPKRSNSPLALFKRTLPASGVIGAACLINATGSKLFCKTALQPFTVKLDSGERFEFEEGFSYEMAGDDFFKSIELVNSGDTALAVELYVGNARVFRAAPLFTRDAATSIEGGAFSMANNDIIGLTGGQSRGRHRKQIVIYNAHATLALQICETSAGGDIIGIIPSKTNYTIFTSGTVYLYNQSGSTITGNFLSTYYD